MKRASSPRTSRRFTGELSWWAPGQCRFFPYKQDFGSGWILEGPAYVGPGTLVVVPGLFILS